MNCLLTARLALALLRTAAGPDATFGDPCATDLKELCADVKPGAGRIVGCLQDHTSQLSSSCRAKVDADRERMKGYVAEFAGACRDDADKLCPGVQPGGGRIVKCLSVHDYELSPRCQTEIARIGAAREKVSELKRLCQADVQRVCRGLEGRAGDLLTCLQANQAELSSECRSAGPAVAMEAGSLVQAVDEATSQARIEDTLQILQGLNTVAFSRNQLSFTYDYFESVGGQSANLNVLTFGSLLVFGPNNEFAVLLKVPVAALFPSPAEAPAVQQPAQSGVADVNTALGWAFYAHGSIRQYLVVGLQWNNASASAIGAPWVVAPVYALAVGLAGWVSLTTEVSWFKSFGNLESYSGVNFLQLRPIVAFNLPSQFYIAVDTQLGWDFIKQIFVPVMRFEAGKLIGRERNVSIGAWYQLSLNTVGKQDSFAYGIGTSVSYFFDW